MFCFFYSDVILCDCSALLYFSHLRQKGAHENQTYWSLLRANDCLWSQDHGAADCDVKSLAIYIPDDDIKDINKITCCCVNSKPCGISFSRIVSLLHNRCCCQLFRLLCLCCSEVTVMKLMKHSFYGPKIWGGQCLNNEVIYKFLWNYWKLSVLIFTEAGRFISKIIGVNLCWMQVKVQVPA